MDNNRIINIVATNCKTEDDARFNKWYDEVHIPLLFKHDGMKKVTRYRLAGENPAQAKYIAIYEFEDQAAFDAFSTSPERTAAMQEMGESWKGDGFDIKWVASYEATKTWEK